MNRFRHLFFFCLLSASVLVGAETRKAAGLPRGQCTWYAYLRCQDAGWPVTFDKPYDRHAVRWWEKVTNARQSAEPKDGSVMVLDAWSGNPYGHVAYVEKVLGSNEWVVTHANFGLGSVAKELEGAKIYTAKCTRTTDGVRFEGSRQLFKLRGFLCPKSAD